MTDRVDLASGTSNPGRTIERLEACFEAKGPIIQSYGN